MDLTNVDSMSRPSKKSKHLSSILMSPDVSQIPLKLHCELFLASESFLPQTEGQGIPNSRMY